MNHETHHTNEMKSASKNAKTPWGLGAEMYPGCRVRTLTERQTQRLLRLVWSRDWSGDRLLDDLMRRIKAELERWQRAGVAVKVVVQWVDGPCGTEKSGRKRTARSKRTDPTRSHGR